MPDPGHNCAFLDTAGQHTWQSSSCSKKLGYICHKDGTSPIPTQSKHKTHEIFHVTVLYECSLCVIICVQHLYCAVFSTSVEQGFCSTPWIPYNGNCFYLNRSPKTWSNAQKECRKEGGDLVSVHNVEEQSFIISQLGYGMQKPPQHCHTFSIPFFILGPLWF